jgi:hypothetical protein
MSTSAAIADAESSETGETGATREDETSDPSRFSRKSRSSRLWAALHHFATNRHELCGLESRPAFSGFSPIQIFKIQSVLPGFPRHDS